MPSDTVLIAAIVVCAVLVVALVAAAVVTIAVRRSQRDEAPGGKNHSVAVDDDKSATSVFSTNSPQPKTRRTSREPPAVSPQDAAGKKRNLAWVITVDDDDENDRFGLNAFKNGTYNPAPAPRPTPASSPQDYRIDPERLAAAHEFVLTSMAEDIPGVDDVLSDDGDEDQWRRGRLPRVKTTEV